MVCSRKCVYCLYSPRFPTRPVGICSGKCVYCRAICFVDHHTHTFDVTLNSCLTKQSFTAHYCVTRSSTHHLNSQGWGLYLVTYVHMLSSLVRCADFRFFLFIWHVENDWSWIYPFYASLLSTHLVLFNPFPPLFI